ncbi:hypothetical protein [Nonomuraea typhae]|uniref:Uncharacterized protein n=1 Tax=Nonomuraea typhae TaxID=2603600 RepID=A0ABW7YRC5_9ACTN
MGGGPRPKPKPDRQPPINLADHGVVVRRSILGGLIHEYQITS